MGLYDGKGYIYIVDRKKEMIVSGEENVYPGELEEVVYRYPTIQEVAIIGILAPLMGRESLPRNDFERRCKRYY